MRLSHPSHLPLTSLPPLAPRLPDQSFPMLRLQSPVLIREIVYPRPDFIIPFPLFRALYSVELGGRGVCLGQGFAGDGEGGRGWETADIGERAERLGICACVDLGRDVGFELGLVRFAIGDMAGVC